MADFLKQKLASFKPVPSVRKQVYFLQLSIVLR